MKGYNPQYADHNHYVNATGQRIDVASLLDGHDNEAEILALCEHVYRPEQLHNNGDIRDDWNPEELNLARVTHEHRTRNNADLAEQASFSGVLWDTLSESYTQFVKLTQRWKGGYQPDAIKPDAKFMRRVNETKLRMQKNSKYKLRMRRRALELGIIK